MVLRVVHPLAPDGGAHRDLPRERQDGHVTSHGPQPVRDRHPLGPARPARVRARRGQLGALQEGRRPACPRRLEQPHDALRGLRPRSREPLGLGLGRLHAVAAGALQPARRLLPHEQRRPRQSRRGPLPVRADERQRPRRAGRPRPAARLPDGAGQLCVAPRHPGPPRLPGGRDVVPAGSGPAHAQGRCPVRPHRQRRLQRLPEAAGALLLGRHVCGGGRYPLPEPLRVCAGLLHSHNGRHPQ